MKALESSEAFWAMIEERGAEYEKSMPRWMKAGIELDPVRYTTYVDDGRETASAVTPPPPPETVSLKK